jgi:hypothetical protein
MLRALISIILAISLIMLSTLATRSGVYTISFSRSAQYCRQVRWNLRSLGTVEDRSQDSMFPSTAAQQR